jgi:hypothetical protein
MRIYSFCSSFNSISFVLHSTAPSPKANKVFSFFEKDFFKKKKTGNTSAANKLDLEILDFFARLVMLILRDQ